MVDLVMSGHGHLITKPTQVDLFMLWRPPLQYTAAEMSISALLRLPDEILDMITRELWLDGYLQQGLVCRRWYWISLPYLWRHTEIDAVNRELHLRHPRNFSSFLIERPGIAALIQQLVLRRVELDMSLIARTLELLPSLRRLKLQYTWLTPVDDPELLTRHINRYRLEHLGFRDSPASQPGTFERATIQLLGLFSEIGELMLEPCENLLEGNALNVEMAVTSDAFDRLRVYQLHTDIHSVFPSYLDILCRRHTFRRLTCLHILIQDLDALSTFNEFLSMVGSTLGELHLDLTWNLNRDGFRLSWDQPSVTTDGGLRRDFVISNLRKGLGSCSSLHGFRLGMSTYCPVGIDYEPPVVKAIAAQGWLMGVDIIEVVTSNLSQQLRHLAFNYECHNNPIGYESHLLAWSRLREICGQCSGLRTLVLPLGLRLKFKGGYTEEDERLWDGMRDVLQRGKAMGFEGCDEHSCRLRK